ncbi:CTP synthase [Gonapodya prolifera JEL478]|uniref:CTP synthase n=1 Tax=Gonapodya prolifera (strain JEL478) TaxID=1344416 RepID=A0A139AEI2_GONPJ|nr:CTP synthase [Gonapodya prolifera JEL478]|eukprot:KXS15168.1 CTP synthase [Gonapodya prolifera JEL478]
MWRSGRPKTKYIAVTGGVISGIGKGIIASSIGFLLKARGFRVTAVKIDPYLNIDAGTMNPLEHGEVFVLNDGGEVDLDLGNYERFLDVELTSKNNITTGKVYKSVIEGERRGDFLGKTVQVVPHITNEIMDRIQKMGLTPVDSSGQDPDICVIELGGTVGDIESMPFIEALRQFQFRVGADNMFFIHVSLVPIVGAVGEQKTKPTQASVKELRGLGISPDMIACRSNKALDDNVISKISVYTHVPVDSVVAVHDCPSIYHVPLLLQSQNALGPILTKFRFINDPSYEENRPDSELLAKWRTLASKYDRAQDHVSIVLVGKYTQLSDAYISVVKSLEHAALAINRKLDLHWIESEHLEESQRIENPTVYHDAWKALCHASGILVPGGFGKRGSEGKIAAIKWARERNVPFLGVCLGMQMAVIEFARNVCGIKDATSEEIDEDKDNKEGKHHIIKFMPEIDPTTMGGTMRLGERKTIFTEAGKDSVARKLYHGRDRIRERHRHRYEVNTDYRALIEEKGMRFVGQDEAAERMEIIELDPALKHPFFLGVQYHPELLSRPLRPSPPYLGLLLAASGMLQEYLDQLGKSKASAKLDASTNGSKSDASDKVAQDSKLPHLSSPDAVANHSDVPKRSQSPSVMTSDEHAGTNGNLPPMPHRQGSLYRNPSFPPDFNTEPSDEDTFETLAATLAASPSKGAAMSPNGLPMISAPSVVPIELEKSHHDKTEEQISQEKREEQAMQEKLGLALPQPIVIVGGGAGRQLLASRVS